MPYTEYTSTSGIWTYEVVVGDEQSVVDIIASKSTGRKVEGAHKQFEVLSMSYDSSGLLSVMFRYLT